MKSKKEILNLMNSDRPLVLYFYATDCKKHKANQATLRRLQKVQKNPEVNTINVEIKRQSQLADELEVEGVPMILLFINGEEKWRASGAITEEKIQRALTSIN